MSDSSYQLTPSPRRRVVVRRAQTRPQTPSEQQQFERQRLEKQRGKQRMTVPSPLRSPQSQSKLPAQKRRKSPVAKEIPARTPQRQNPNFYTVRPTSVGSANVNSTTIHPRKMRTVPIPDRGVNPYAGRNNVKKSVRVRKQQPPKRVMVGRRSRLKPMARNILYGLRLLIVGVGISAIVGTALSVLDPATRMNSGNQINPTAQPTQTAGVGGVMALTQEMPNLKTAVQNLASANPTLTPGVFVLDLGNGAYVDLNGGATFSAASTIKIPILVAFFQEVDAGNIRLDETMTMKQEFVTGGSGDMQYKPVGTKYTALEVASKMMVISDNTATNMLIDRLGGIASLNQRFQSWGLQATQIRNVLPDLEGTNTTTPKELGQLMTMLSKGNLVSMISRDRVFDIMRQTVRDTMLPSGVGEETQIAHKTGDIRSMVGDAGLVDLPSGKRYAIAVMVQRPDNDPKAERLIGSISRTVYQQFTQATSVGATTPTNSNNSNSATPNPSIPSSNLSNQNSNGTNIPSSSIPNQNLPLQNQQLTNPGFNSTTYQNPYQTPYQNPGMSPQMVTPTYQMYQTPAIAPQYYYPYQR